MVKLKWVHRDHVAAGPQNSDEFVDGVVTAEVARQMQNAIGVDA
jgi:hypothetical protein